MIGTVPPRCSVRAKRSVWSNAARINATPSMPISAAAPVKLAPPSRSPPPSSPSRFSSGAATSWKENSGSRCERRPARGGERRQQLLARAGPAAHQHRLKPQPRGQQRQGDAGVLAVQLPHQPRGVEEALVAPPLARREAGPQETRRDESLVGG